MVLDAHVVGTVATNESDDVKRKVFGIDVFGQFSGKGNFDGVGHSEPSFASCPQSGCLCAVDSCGQCVECSCCAGVAVGANDNHSGFGMVGHYLMANAVAYVVEFLYRLRFSEISDGLVLGCQF